MSFINNTLIRKQLANEARDEKTSYTKYMKLVEKARANGFENEQIIHELESEKFKISFDKREGDHIFQQGMQNSKVSCINAINRIIAELNGEES